MVDRRILAIGFVVVALCCAAVPVGLWIASRQAVEISKGVMNVAAQTALVGDSFGIVNTIFTGWALVAIVAAIFVQIEQLKSQDENLVVYKGEVAKTLAHLEQEERWTRLRAKLDVLPSLLRRNEYRLRAQLGSDVEIAPEFYNSDETIAALEGFLEEHIARLGGIVASSKEAEAALDAARRKMGGPEASAGVESGGAVAEVDLSAADYDASVHNLMSGNTLVDKARRAREEEARCLPVLLRYQQALERLRDTRRLWVDLEQAYREAQSL